LVVSKTIGMSREKKRESVFVWRERKSGRIQLNRRGKGQIFVLRGLRKGNGGEKRFEIVGKKRRNDQKKTLTPPPQKETEGKRVNRIFTVRGEREEDKVSPPSFGAKEKGRVFT